ncbi:hypothetical protein G6F65_020304 [Rhizopus arrhizus]|nr:hypothetical protein G6F65_020304 [Rhizopus arrhizus]
MPWQAGICPAEQGADAAFGVREGGDRHDAQASVHRAQADGGVVDIGQRRLQHDQRAGPAGIAVIDVHQVVAAADAETQVGQGVHKPGVPGIVLPEENDIQRVVH